MDTDTLKEIFYREVKEYAKDGFNSTSYLTLSEDGCVIAVITTAKVQNKRYTFASLVAKLVKDRIIVEEDRNDKILLDSLLQAGVPREQIVLAYAGEPVEEPV